MRLVQVTERDAIFKPIPRGSWLWCLHCNRTYEHGKFRLIGDLQMCPYADCDGDVVIDSVIWSEVRREHSHYPEVPAPGVVYPF